jgi:Ca2+-binding EF-hand superfamily protein
MKQIESLFTLLDVDNTGGLSREEMTDGLEQVTSFLLL